LACLFFLFRIGFDNSRDTSFFSIYSVLSLSWFILLLAPNIRLFMKMIRRIAEDAWYNSDAFIAFAGLAVLIFAGWMGSATGIYFLFPFVLAGTVFFILGTMSFFGQIHWWQLLIAIFLTIGYSCWLAGLIWGGGYLNPLYFEGLFFGFGHIDTLFHGAIAGMIKTYGVVSTGLDGLPYFSYHTGSHWIFAQLSSLLRMRVLTFYQLGFPVIFIPLLISLILMLILNVREYFFKDMEINLLADFRFWFFFICLQIGILPVMFDGIIGPCRGALFACESYAVSTIFALFLGLIFLSFFFNKSSQTAINNLLLFFLSPFLLGLVLFCKISVGYFIVILSVYLFFRSGLYTKKKYVLSMILTLLTACIVGGISILLGSGGTTLNYAGDSLSISLFHSSWLGNLSAVPKTIIPFFHFLYYLLAIIFLAFRLSSAHVSTLGEFVVAIRKKQLLDVEILLIVLVAGMVPGMLFSLDSGGDWYFADFQNLIALCFFVAFLPAFLPAKKVAPLPKNYIADFKFIYLLVIPFIITIFLNATIIGSRALNINLSYRMTVINHSMVTSFRPHLKQAFSSKDINKIINDISSLFSSQKIEEGFRGNKLSPVMKSLLHLNDLPLQQKRKSLLYVSHTQDYWYKLPKRKHIPFIFPAVTEIAQIDGLPPYGDKECDYYKHGYGYGTYKLRTGVSKPEDSTVPVLCARAKKQGFSNLLVLNSATGDIKTYSCK
ncbi:hypothetical protein KKB18_12220, partial [bacterium]|nr:hypothetical protein [bacterium]